MNAPFLSSDKDEEELLSFTQFRNTTVGPTESFPKRRIVEKRSNNNSLHSGAHDGS